MTPLDPRELQRRVLLALAVLITGVVALAIPTPASAASPAPVPAGADWLTVVNYYRSMAGVSPVVEDPAWSAGALAHSRYMVRNGVVAHDEVDGATAWTPEGDAAGNAGNVAVHSSASTTARTHIEQWMAGPFHAIGVLRPALRSTGFGQFTDPAAATWRSAATLDVTRGVDPAAARPSTPILFPGDGTSTNLDRMAPESPDPRSFCGWTGTVGLPLVAMLPTAPGSVTASLTGPDGPVTVCALTESSTSGVAASILAGDNAVAIVPKSVLTPGTYTATLSTSGAGAVTWSFTVDPAVADGAPVTAALSSTAPLGAATKFQPLGPIRVVDTRTGLGSRRLAANTEARLDIAGRLGVPARATAVSANLTVVGPGADGYLTAYPCGGAAPEVSALNFGRGQTVPNAAVLPLDATGDLCVVSTTATDLIVDVSGAFSADGTDRYSPVAPARILDTRSTGRIAATGGTITLAVRGVSGIPSAATAIAVNVTAVNPSATPNGYVTVYPCGVMPNASNLNLNPGETRPNLVIVPVSAQGTICLTSTIGTDLLVDVSGFFAPTAARAFTPLAPIRMLDTRQADARLSGRLAGRQFKAGEMVPIMLAGERGIPAGTTAVSANVTVTGARGDGYLTVYPCGARPEVSTVNYRAGVDIANAAQLTLDGSGQICVYAQTAAWVLIDVNGAWG